MQILSRKVMHYLVVIEHVQDNILGIVYIRKHSLSYNSFLDKCFCEIHPFDSGQLKAAERTHFIALCSLKIKLKCMNKNNILIGISN
jgi:hypothetical protein